MKSFKTIINLRCGLASADRGKSRHDNAVFLTKIYKFFRLKIRIQLNLIIDWSNYTIIQNILQLRNVKITNANALNFALFLKLFQGLYVE